MIQTDGSSGTINWGDGPDLDDVGNASFSFLIRPIGGASSGGLRWNKLNFGAHEGFLFQRVSSDETDVQISFRASASGSDGNSYGRIGTGNLSTTVVQHFFATFDGAGATRHPRTARVSGRVHARALRRRARSRSRHRDGLGDERDHDRDPVHGRGRRQRRHRRPAVARLCGIDPDHGRRAPLRAAAALHTVGVGQCLGADPVQAKYTVVANTGART